MAGSNDDEEIAAESPQHAAEGTDGRPQGEAAHEEIETEKIEEDVAQRSCSKEAEHPSDASEQVGRTVGRRNLIGGHAGEQAVGPARGLARGLVEEFLFVTLPHACHRVVAAEDKTLAQRGEEIDQAEHQKAQDHKDIGP